VLIAAVVVPGPPAFVPELMGSAAHELDELRQAADSVVSRAVSDLLAVSHDSPSFGSAVAQLVIVGPGEPGEYHAAGTVSLRSFGRDVPIAALADGQRTDNDLPTPLMVARYLAGRDVASHPEHSDLWAAARWITTSGADSTSLGERLRDDGTRIAVILVADGALCHGPKAPRAEDPRAEAYDDEVCDVLTSGKLGRLAQIDPHLGDELGASWPKVWPVLFTAADGDGIGEVLWQGAPYGVGWVVAEWRPAQGVARD
jgi:hypothetical protein